MNLSSALFIAAINNTLAPNKYNMLANWLGCNEFRAPADRFIDRRLLIILLPILLDKYPNQLSVATLLFDEATRRLGNNISADDQQEIINYYEYKIKSANS